MCVSARPRGAHPPSLSVFSVTPAAQWDGGIWEEDQQGHCSVCNWIIHNIARLIKDKEPAAMIGYVTALPSYTILELFYWHWIISEDDDAFSSGLRWYHVFVSMLRESYPFPQKKRMKRKTSAKKHFKQNNYYTFKVSIFWHVFVAFLPVAHITIVTQMSAKNVKFFLFKPGQEGQLLG